MLTYNEPEKHYRKRKGRVDFYLTTRWVMRSWSAQGGWRGRPEWGVSRELRKHIPPLDRSLEGKGRRKDRRKGGMDGRQEEGECMERETEDGRQKRRREKGKRQ